MTDDTDALRAALTDIRGVGDATADTVIEVLQDHAHGQTNDVQAVVDHLEAAHDAHKAGDHSYASKYVRRAYDELHTNP